MPDSTFFDRLSSLGHHRFLLLFLFLMSVLILYPYMGDTGTGYYLFRVLGSIVMLLSIYAVSFRRGLLIFPVLLSLPVFIHRMVLGHVVDANIFYTICSLAFDVFVAIIIFRRVVRQDRITSETIFGALSVYLVIGFSFANIYNMVSLLQPSAFYFSPLLTPDKVRHRFDFVYYSFTSMTSLGASGISPISEQARSLTAIQSILGILYLAALISRLVSAYHPALATNVEVEIHDDRAKRNHE
jgi:hypothetical protein